MTACFVLIFESVHKVFKTEKVLTAHHIKFDIIPTPKEYSSDCGMSIRLKQESTDLDKIKLILQDNSINFIIHEKSMQ